MSANEAEPRPYHHGDLRRALIEAAERLLVREGTAALSLRAVAREAGVSPAAPYHHFKDKDALLGAVAKLGFDRMSQAMREASEGAPDPAKRLNAMGVAYVCFARDHRALYHLMYDANRAKDFRANAPRDENSAYAMIVDALATSGVHAPNPLDLELAQIAGWCAAHGLAEMANAREFDGLKARLGGDKAFFSAVLAHLGAYRFAPEDIA